MKKINEMSVKELREVAKELNIAGRWDMTKAQLVEAIEKIENEKEAEKQVNKEHKLVPMPGTEDPDWGKKAAGIIETAKTEEKVKAKTAIEKAMRVQRAFVEVGDTRKEAYRYITITVKNVEESKATEYIDAVCAKMQEMDEEFEAEYTALKCPDYDEATKSYTDMISFTKAAGKIAVQRQYVGKLMTKAMAALK